jgi:hypothetical protein
MNREEKAYVAHRSGRTWRYVKAGDRVYVKGVEVDVLSRDATLPGIVEFEIRFPDGSVKKGRPKLDEEIEFVPVAPDLALALLKVRLGAETVGESRTVEDDAGMTVRQWRTPPYAEMSRAVRIHHLTTFHDVYGGDYEGDLEALHASTPAVVEHSHEGIA